MFGTIIWAVHFAQDLPLFERLAQGSSILVLLAAAILVFRTFRERYLLIWILGWFAFLIYSLAAPELADAGAAVTAMSDAAFLVAVALFSAAALYYSNARRHLWVVAILLATALLLAVVRAWWLPHSQAATLLLHLLYLGMSVGAAIRLALFSRGRRSLGLWLTAVALPFVHLDRAAGSVHTIAGGDLLIELFLGLGMLVIVLDDSQARRRRLAVVSAITNAIANAREPGAMMQQVLAELKQLTGACAAWYRLLQEDKLVMVYQAGLSDTFVRAHRSWGTGPAYGAQVVRQGVPGVFRTKDVEVSLQHDLLAEGIEHVVVIPLRGKNSVTGTLAIAGAHRRSYTADELDFLQATTDQLGVALENLRLVERILHSQRQWVSTFDSIGDVILLHDRDCRLIKVNRALLRRLGRTYHEVVSATCETVLPRAGEWSGCPYCGRVRTPLSDAPDPCFGGYSLVSTSSYAEEGSEPAGTIHIIKDTTERRAIEAQYRMFFEQVQEGVFIASAAGRLLDCNDAFVRMLGYSSRAEVMALDISSQLYVFPDQREAFRQEIAAHNYVRNYEVLLRRKDGSIITVLENSFATRDASGRIERYQGFLLDVTEKKRSEDEIRRRNRELHALNAIASIATQSFDLDEILNLTLRQVMDLLAADAGSVYLFDEESLALRRRAAYGHYSEPSARFPEIQVPRDLWESIKASRMPVLTHRHAVQLPSLLSDYLSGENLQCWICAIMWSKDKAVGLIGIGSRRPREYSSIDENLLIAIGHQLATTIDKVGLYEETCRAYDDLRRTQEQLLQSEKMSAVGQMISGVAHELNNPLTAILGYAQLLEGENLDEHCRDYVQKVFKQAQRTQRVVQNLLSFARQRKPQKGQVDLRRVLEDTLALRDYDLKLNNITVEREFSAILPTTTADAHQIEQVFLNIINNSVDAMLAAARTGLLKVRIYAEGPHVCAEFQDSGPGMKEPHRVFDPFYTTKTVGKGTGLGLSICYGIVKEHHGDIQAMNAPSGGALIRVLLPSSVGVVGPQPESQPVRRETLLQGRILLADHEETVLDFEREVLTGAGAEVVCVRQGSEALARLESEHYDAAILDISLPGVCSGLEMYRSVIEKRPQLRKRMIVTLTNVNDPAVQAFLEETGVPCIVKPFQVADLISMARRILSDERSAAVGR